MASQQFALTFTKCIIHALACPPSLLPDALFFPSIGSLSCLASCALSYGAPRRSGWNSARAVNESNNEMGCTDLRQQADAGFHQRRLREARPGALSRAWALGLRRRRRQARSWCLSAQDLVTGSRAERARGPEGQCARLLRLRPCACSRTQGLSVKLLRPWWRP